MRWELGGPNKLPSKGSNTSASYDRQVIFFPKFPAKKEHQKKPLFLAMVGYVGWLDPSRFQGSPFSTADFIRCYYWLYCYLSWKHVTLCRYDEQKRGVYMREYLLQARLFQGHRSKQWEQKNILKPTWGFPAPCGDKSRRRIGQVFVGIRGPWKPIRP